MARPRGQEMVEISWEQALKFLENYGWDWVYFHLAEMGDKKFLRISFSYGRANISADLRPSCSLSDFWWEVWGTLVDLHETSGVTIVKGKETDTILDIRAYSDGYEVPSHILARGVLYPWEGA